MACISAWGGRVLGAVNLVDCTRQYLPLVHQHGAEGPATGLNVGAGQFEGFAHVAFFGHESVLLLQELVIIRAWAAWQK
ncbi:hypothetical protein QIY50_20945 [Pseudomonas putida]|nr:hypothetical protein QIY50_20945 [Pseudomonas putida]